MAHLLVIDDDLKICTFLLSFISEMGHKASAVNSLKDGLNMASDNDYDLILLDLEFPEGNGLQILPDLLELPSNPEVIIITGTGGAGGAELAFKYGAWDYIQKPFVFHEVSLPITRALQYRQEKKTTKITVPLKRDDIIGQSPGIERCLDLLAKSASTDASVLITGETGTGKELFARAIHENSSRSEGNFISVDCGALPETLIESTLFGHEKGAYTGAEKKQDGLIMQADGGTLFLDEIGDLPLNSQKTFLRTLQEKCIRPLGAKEEKHIDFRLVSATNRDLEAMVKEKKFREDLLFRIRAIEIKLPPLRDREQDIQEITTRKIPLLCQRYGLGTKGISPEVMDILMAQEWAGNVRELINALEFALAYAGDDPTLFAKHLPPSYRAIKVAKDSTISIKKEGPLNKVAENQGKLPTLFEYRKKMDKDYLKVLLENTGGDRQKACQQSGLSQSRLYSLLKEYNLSRFNS